jgi:hypothetical protein
MTSVMPWERPGSKIDDRHLQRLAVIYIRQSTCQQLVDHQESTRLQYALVDHVVALGWQADRILLIDEDLGKSGRVPSPARASSVWSPRSGWTTSVSCWGSRCPVWPAPARTGTS